jgi:hypothetical protein
MLQFRIPKKEVDLAVVLNTPAAADADLTTGMLTLRDENASTALKVKISDIVGWKKEAYSAGTAHIVDVDVTGAVLTANNMYNLTIEVPNVVEPESNAISRVRTYTISVDGTPTVAELQTLLINKVNSDTANSGCSAASAAGDICRITASSALMGKLVVKTNITGVTVADQTAYVAPVGTPTEVAQYLLPTTNLTTSGNEYSRYTLVYRKFIRHNDIKGLKAVKDAEAFFYAEENAADFAAFETALDAILDGTATAADYLGAPAL